MSKTYVVLLALATFATVSAPAFARDPSPPRGGEWYLHDPNRACETYRRVGSNAIASPFEIDGRLYVFRRGPACNYSMTTTTIRGGQFDGRSATIVNVR